MTGGAITAGRALLLALAAVLGVWVALAGPVLADDSYDSFSASYVVGPEGVVTVTETLVYRFGPESPRHGIDRLLLVREPYDDESDRVFEVSNIAVSSPDPVATQWRTYEERASAREVATVIRIGDPDVTVAADTATYVISYELRGALRSSGGFPELYWDAIGGGFPAIRAADFAVSAPGGAQEVLCDYGPPDAGTPCTSASIESGVAVFTQDGLTSGDLLTFAVRLQPDAVANAEPTLVPRGDAQDESVTRVMQGAGIASILAIPLAGWWYLRTKGRDQRFAGVPPGMTPLEGAQAAVEPHDPRMEIPVVFTPPDLPLSHAGYLLEGHYKVEHLTATLVQLATVGALQLGTQRGETAVALDPARVPDRQAQVVYSALFAHHRDSVEVAQATELATASDWLQADARAAASGGWFKRLGSSRAATIGSVTGLFFFAVFVTQAFGGPLGWLVFPATLAFIVTSAVVGPRIARGRRTPVGRAWTDRVEGFRTYLTTAEADQLRFEEGVDIFSRYLPWAVLFGVADRWVAVCRQAVDMGRLAPPDTSWYGGTFWDSQWVLRNLNNLNSSVRPATASARSTGGSSFTGGAGGGGGSAFGGGGISSGGGGGGGGSRSW